MAMRSSMGPASRRPGTSTPNSPFSARSGAPGVLQRAENKFGGWGRTLAGMDGSPIGRRVFLGVLGVGAVGVLWGAKAQDWLEKTVAPLVAKDGSGLSAFLPIGRF